MFGIFGLLILIAVNAEVLFAEYPACGSLDDEITEAGLEENIDGHVTRLLKLRNSNGGWANTPEVFLSIQLTEPESFSNLDKSIRRMEEEIQDGISSITIGELAQYMLAVKSACKNTSSFGEVNLKKKLLKKLKGEFYRNGIQLSTPEDGWYGVFLATEAYCVSQAQSPGDEFIHRILHAQNRDGSFGNSASIDHTTRAMMALLCLSRINAISSTQREQVKNSLNLATQFLRSKITTERDDVWFGDKYATPAGVLAIKEHTEWADNAWRCRLMMRSLNRQHSDTEGESAISQRLLALKGVSYLSMLNVDYSCSNSEGTIQDNTIETSLGEDPSPIHCSQEENGQSNFLFSKPAIDIDIAIQSYILPNVITENLDAKVVTLRDVIKGKTLLELLTTAQCRGLLTFKSEKTGWGEYITAIDGKQANSENKEYWSIQRNGESLDVGINQFKPAHSDYILFKLKKWS
ncbi:transcobalamin-1-like isoform X1 [Styela clava]